jgi:hypothetical protein
MAGYWSEGRFVAGSTLRTAGVGGVSGLELEVAAAVARARKNGGALTELRHLLTTYPVLKREPAEGEEHPLKPLVWLYADEQLIGRGQKD